MLCGIPWWWIRSSANPWIIILAEALFAGKAKPYLYCLFQALPLPWQKQFSVINLPTDSWLFTQGNCAISGIQCWSQMLADWRLSNGCSHISLGKQKFLLCNLWITSIPVNRATLFMSPLENNSSDWVISKKQVTLSPWLLKSSTLDVTLW